MQVVRDDRGRDGEQPLEVVDPGAVRRERLPVLQVADVVTDPRAATLREAERALELRAARKDRRRRRDGQQEAVRHPAARAAQDERAADDRVVGARRDRAVVDEEGVGDAAEPLARVVVGERDRLVGHVPARQHERHARVHEQEVVQRRVGQHHAELAQARGDGVRDGAPGARGAITIGRSRPASRAAAAASSTTSARAASRSAAISANGRSSRCLRRAQRGHCGRVVRPAREVVSAEPLDRDDRAAAQQRRRPPPRRPRRSPPGEKAGARPAGGARIGLGVEAPVGGSWYSARHAAHIAKPAIVVRARSYGTPRTIVKRGPQSVQLTNG